MKSTLTRPVQFLALLMSVVISVTLMNAISTGLRATQVVVVELPPVTVVATRHNGVMAKLAVDPQNSALSKHL